MTKKELLTTIEFIDYTDNPDTVFRQIFKAVSKYQTLRGTKDTRLDGIFDHFLFDNWVIDYVKQKLDKNGIGRVCSCLRGIHKSDAEVFVSDQYGNLHECTRRDNQQLRSKILHALNDPSVEDEYINLIRKIDKNRPSNEIFCELRNIAIKYMEETGYEGFKFLFEDDAALKLFEEADKDKNGTEINIEAMLEELEDRVVSMVEERRGYKRLTGQESGIWLYKLLNKAIICNWDSSSIREDCIPLLFGEGLVWLPLHKKLNWEQTYEDEPIQEWIESFNIVYDQNNDAENVDWSKTVADIYDCGDYAILVPKGWN